MRAATKGSEMLWRRAVMPIKSGAFDSSGPGGSPTAAPDMMLGRELEAVRQPEGRRDGMVRLNRCSGTANKREDIKETRNIESPEGGRGADYIPLTLLSIEPVHLLPSTDQWLAYGGLGWLVGGVAQEEAQQQQPGFAGGICRLLRCVRRGMRTMLGGSKPWPAFWRNNNALLLRSGLAFPSFFFLVLVTPTRSDRDQSP